MKPTILIAAALLCGSCTHRALVTLSQPHVVTRVDTVGKHLRYYLRPTGSPRSSYGNRLKPGDSLVVLHNYFIRY